MSTDSLQISIVVPVFNESATIGNLLDRLRNAMSSFSHEIVIVDDGSSDGTADLMGSSAEGPFGHFDTRTIRERAGGCARGDRARCG